MKRLDTRTRAQTRQALSFAGEVLLIFVLLVVVLGILAMLGGPA